MVSMIIPVYNVQDDILMLLDDLYHQTYTDLEVIIIDDYSTDNSKILIDKYIETHELKGSMSIRCVRMDKQRGVSASRNFGIALAHGEYIRFVDADDRLPETSVEKLVDEMESAAVSDLVVGNFSTRNVHDLYCSETAQIIRCDIKAYLDGFAEYPRAFYYGVVWNKLYRRNVIVEKRILFNETMDWCEDYTFNIDYLMHCRRVSIIPEDIYVYVRHEGSLVTKIGLGA